MLSALKIIIKIFQVEIIFIFFFMLKHFKVSIVEPGVFCQNSPNIISSSHFEKLQEKIYTEMDSGSKKIISKSELAERLEFCTTRINGFNSLEPVIEEYVHALFRNGKNQIYTYFPYVKLPFYKFPFSNAKYQLS